MKSVPVYTNILIDHIMACFTALTSELRQHQIYVLIFFIVTNLKKRINIKTKQRLFFVRHWKKIKKDLRVRTCFMDDSPQATEIFVESRI